MRNHEPLSCTETIEMSQCGLLQFDCHSMPQVSTSTMNTSAAYTEQSREFISCLVKQMCVCPRTTQITLFVCLLWDQVIDNRSARRTNRHADVAAPLQNTVNRTPYEEYRTAPNVCKVDMSSCVISRALQQTQWA